ncbi:MAG: hypothetical protein U0T82_03985 [Bacteroidales bacterium]
MTINNSIDRLIIPKHDAYMSFFFITCTFLIVSCKITYFQAGTHSFYQQPAFHGLSLTGGGNESVKYKRVSLARMVLLETYQPIVLITICYIFSNTHFRQKEFLIFAMEFNYLSDGIGSAAI